MPMQSLELPVTGTAWRPDFLQWGVFRLFVWGRNNLNPQLIVDDEGLQIRVTRSVRLDWQRMSQVDVRQGLNSVYAVISHAHWEYIAHFRDLQGLGSLIDCLRRRGVRLTPAAQTFANDAEA